MNRGLRLSSLVIKSFAIAVLTAALVHPQRSQAQPPPSGANPQSITTAWDSLLQGAIPQAAPDPVLTVPQSSVVRGPVDDFLNHFYFDSRNEYIRDNSYFTGNPTITGVINTQPTGVFNPNGIPFPGAFQPSSNEFSSFIDLGTTGWLSDRINTHFSMRYDTDLTHVDAGSQGQDLLNAYPTNRIYQLLTANVEILGKPGDGWFANSSFVVGRQNVFGAELAEFDGGSFTTTKDDGKFSMTLYGGRRYTYFSDPLERGIGGGNFIFRFSPDSSVEYDGLMYIRASHYVSYRRRINSHLQTNGSYKMIGSFPVELKGSVIWTPSDKGMIQVSFAERLTDKDYIYDYTDLAKDLNTFDSLFALNLGRLAPYSQLMVQARRSINSRVRLGGEFWGRRLLHSQDAGPFDTSFTDYKANAQILPFGHIETFFDFHQHNSNRMDLFNPNDFFDITQAGETRIQDFSAEIGRNFGPEGRFRIKAGGFYRRMNFQDRFYVINNVHDRGLLADLSFKLDDRTRLFINWDLDTDFFLFTPNLKDSQIFRVGTQWRY